ncbi:MAG: SHOCT domain-containing protein [Clostridia bacterium]|nr:SHOCT domain-containing protein [Clostridia bacterium]
MLLCMFVPFYSIFWTYKTAQRIDTIAKTRGMSSEIATPCLVLAIFVGIVPPILMQDKINAIALNGNAPAAAPAAEPARDVGESTRAAADGVPEELEKYKRLLDNGVITQEEFEAKKKQLLGL